MFTNKKALRSVDMLFACYQAKPKQAGKAGKYPAYRTHLSIFAD